MTRPPLICLLAVTLLAGCQQRATAPTADPDASVAAVPEAATAPAAAATVTAQPSFDCSQATAAFAQLVCQDPALAALDRQLADTFGEAMAKSADKDRLQAEQRGWIKGRDDCWKADDKTACARDAYVMRIVDLRIQHGLAAAPTTVTFRCDDSSKPFTATFHNDEPRAAVLTWGDDRAVVPAAISASGARYATQGIEFWEHQGEAKVDFFGTRMTCKPAN